MAYYMEYDMQTIKKTQIKPRRSWNKKYGKIVAAILIIVVGIMLSQMEGGLLELMFPGEGIRAENAMEQMVENIREGESLKAAVTAFCQEIIEYE